MSYNYHLNTHEDMIQNSIIDLIIFIVITHFMGEIHNAISIDTYDKFGKNDFSKSRLLYIFHFIQASLKDRRQAVSTSCETKGTTIYSSSYVSIGCEKGTESYV